MNANRLRELFGEMRDDPVPPESLARVRVAVTGRVQARRRRVGAAWKIAAALAMGGCVAAVMLKVRTAAPLERPAATPAAAVEPAAPVVAPRRALPARAKPVAHRQVQAAPTEGGASEIRIENPEEPDVVIVLIGG